MQAEQKFPIYPVASFVGEDCLGNQHWVCINPRFPSSRDRQAWLAEVNEPILVFLFIEPGLPPTAEFYQAGRAIFRCGSGNLAAAHVLFQEMNLADTGFLETAAGRVALRAQGEWLGYGAEGLALQENSEAEYWQSFVSQPLVSCWSVGGNYDYCLLELPNEQAVLDLTVDVEALRQSSDRALIVTARAASDAYDYVLRYFAPQHGKPEDAATGSANLQVATFWRQHLGKACLKGRQLSKSGGEFFLEVGAADYAWVMGRTRGI